MNFSVDSFPPAAHAALILASDLASIGSVTFQQRLDGYALFEDDVMFGFVDEKGVAYLRTSPRTAQRLHALGSTKHDEMPYWTVPRAALADRELLREIAYEAADIAHLALSFGVTDDDTMNGTFASIVSAVTTGTLLLAA